MGKIVPVNVPPGAYRNGTEYQSQGRWRDVNLVRWHEGSMKPHTGWGQSTTEYGMTGQVFSHSGAFNTIGQGEPIGCIAWQDNSDNSWYAWTMDTGGQWVMEDDGTLHNLGDSNSFGTTSDWAHWDTFGEIPLMCANSNGRIYEWDLNTANAFTEVTNAPTDCVGLVVADERFVLALKKREVAWCDRDDRTVWTAAATNQAGSFPLDTEGELMAGLQMRGEVLIISSRDAFSARYVGYPDVWEFRRIGRCTLLGGNAVARVDDRAFWWGDDGFYTYSGGYVQKIPCDVWDYVSGDLSDYTNALTTSRRRTFAWHNSDFGEVVWQYYTATSGADKYVAYNYLNNSWSYGESPIGCVAPKIPFEFNLGTPDIQNRLSHSYSSDPGYTLGTNWQIGGGTLDQSAPTASAASYDLTGLPANWPIVIWINTSGRTVGTLTVTGTTMSPITVTADEQYATYGRTDASGAFTITFTGDGTYDGGVTKTDIYDYPVINVEDGSYEYTNVTNAPYAKSGPIELAPGESRVHVTRLIPDTQDSGELDFTFTTREYPTATETTHGPYTAANPTSVRFSGRQFTMKVEPAATGVDWRSGIHRLEISKGGKR